MGEKTSEEKLRDIHERHKQFMRKWNSRVALRIYLFGVVGGVLLSLFGNFFDRLVFGEEITEKYIVYGIIVGMLAVIFLWAGYSYANMKKEVNEFSKKLRL